MSEQLGLFGEPADQEPAKTTKRETESRIQYFDLETQKSADDVGGWGNIHKMKLAVGVVWDSIDQDYFVYEEKDAKTLVENSGQRIWSLVLMLSDLIIPYYNRTPISICKRLIPLICWLMLRNFSTFA